jgi:hypothetical protein
LIHLDICGPMTFASLNGYLYYVLFIYDHSRKTWIYFLKNKDGVLAKFQEFKARIENQTGRKIKILRSDNGGEYTSKEFKSFCIEAGIKREFTIPYNPQQNGVAERKNKTIIEATKAMIHDQSLPMTLWAEACMTSVYVQNLSPHYIVKNITPEEAFTKVKPEIRHFRIFGCPVYLHVPKEKRSKVEPSGRKGIFVGYNETSKAYRIYILGQRQIEVSRDDTFEEEVAFHKSREAQMEIDSETIHSSPSAVQRETYISPDEPIAPVDPVAPSNIPRDIAIRHKRPTWARKTLQEAEGYKAPQGTTRESKRPKRFSSYLSVMTHIIDSESNCHGEASGEQVWQDAMIEEYKSILKNDVWDVVPRREGKSVVTSKWIYKIKHVVDGSIKKYKARFVAKGFSQIEGVDYDKTFAPVARYTSIRSIIVLATSMDWKLHQMDVKTTFLNGEIEEEVYIEQPEGFVVHNKKSHVCRLKKALYGLKQAPHAWYEKMDGFMMSLGFNKSIVDPNLYYQIDGNECLILVLYVNDLFLTGSERLIVECKQAFTAKFEIKDLGLMHCFLGLEVWQRTNEIFLSQGKYTMEILKKFSMTECKSMPTLMVMDLKKMSDTI